MKVKFWEFKKIMITFFEKSLNEHCDFFLILFIYLKYVLGKDGITDGPKAFLI